MSNSQVQEIVRYKRDHFRTEIRRQRLESAFAIKRQKSLHMFHQCEEISDAFDAPLSGYLNLLLGTLDLSQLESVLATIADKITKYGMREAFDLMRETESLTIVLQLLDNNMPAPIVKYSLWILTNLALADDVCSILVFDTTLVDRLWCLLTGGNQQLAGEVFDLLGNLVLDNDIEILEYLLDQDIFLTLIKELSRCYSLSMEVANLVRVMGQKLISFDEHFWTRPSMNTLLYCVSQTHLEYNSLWLISHMIEECHYGEPTSIQVALYLIQHHYGLVAKVVGSLEPLVARTDQLLLKITLRIVTQLSEMRDVQVENTLVQLRVVHIISKIFASITLESVLAMTCDLLNNLLEIEHIVNYIGPFIIQDLFRYSQSGQQLNLKESATTCLVTLATVVDEETLQFMLMQGLVELFVSSLNQQTMELGCLRALKDLLNTDDKSIVQRISTAPGIHMIDELQRSRNPETSQIAISILTAFNEFELFLQT